MPGLALGANGLAGQRRKSEREINGEEAGLSRQNSHHMVAFDCVILVDCHLSPGAERRLYALLDAHTEGAVSTGVIALHRGWRTSSWLRSAAAGQRMSKGKFAWLDPDIPVRTKLALVLSPGLAAFGRNRALRLIADQVVIWPIEADLAAPAGTAQALIEQGERIQTILDAPVRWAARSENEQRYLAERLTGLDLAPEIWWPLIASETAADNQRSKPQRTVGRHWRLKQLSETAWGEWQDGCREPWGADLHLSLRGEHDLLESLPPMAPAQITRHEDHRFRRLDEFLADLDLFVALGEGRDAARIDEEILEALAAGLVVIATPPTSARYDNRLPNAEACFLGDLAERLLSDDHALETARREQADLFEQRYGVHAYRQRLAAMPSQAAPATPLVWSGRTRRPGHVLFVSDDSLYLEHLPRQLAIARHLQAPLKPYFLTMARDAALAEQMSFPVEYLLAHSSKTYRSVFDQADAGSQELTQTYSSLFDGAEVWNQHLARHLLELISFLDVKAIVFDGVFPFASLAEVHARHQTLPFAWIRRGLWQAGAEEGGLARSSMFDLVIEPQDLASSFDRGPTRTRRKHVVPTEPIRLSQSDAPSRARFELGIEADRPAVFLQPTVPGDQRRGEALAELMQGLAEGGCRFWTTDLVPGAPSLSWPVEAIHLDRLSAGQKLAAFDIVISGADYRSAHDAAAIGKPTVFMQDSGKTTDDQMTRAATAALDGWAVVLARGDVYGARAIARRLLDPAERAVMTGLAADGDTGKGAEQAALAISQMIYALKLAPSAG